MTGRQKFLLSLAYKYCPQYDIKFDRDRDVMTLRVWLDKYHFLSISDVPSLAGTNKFQVKYCEQTQNYFGPSPRVGGLDKMFGKQNRKPGEKHNVFDAYKLTDVLSNYQFPKKETRNPLNEDAVYAACPRDLWY